MLEVIRPMPIEDAELRIECLDPDKTDELTQDAFPFDGIVERARKLLKRRSAQEIRAGAEMINWLLQAPHHLRQTFRLFDGDAVGSPTDSTVHWLVSSDVVALARCVDFITLPETPEFTRGQWHELFAILALCHVDRGMRELRGGSTGAEDFGGEPDTPSQQKSWTGFALARQAIELAEQLADEILVKRKHDKPKRRDPQRELLKTLVVQLAQAKYADRSKRRAGIAIFAGLRASGRLDYDEQTGCLAFDGHHVLSNDDPAHRFAIWIGKARKK